MKTRTYAKCVSHVIFNDFTVGTTYNVIINEDTDSVDVIDDEGCMCGLVLERFKKCFIETKLK